VARKSNLIKLGDAINQLFKEEKLDIKISQFSVKNNWKDIAGVIVANSTSEIFFNNKTIFITLNSAALKHELSFRKEELVKLINTFCGYKLIDQIVIR
jgi:predicted nucleic acid-binding Zn ribbon protein